MKRLLGLSLLVIALALTGCAGKDKVVTDQPYKQGEILAASGMPIAFDTLIKEAAGADYVLLAETHSDIHHHEMQGAIISALAKSGSKPSLGLEMLTKDKQAVLDQFNSKKITLAQFATRTDWNHVWRFAYALYEPVVKVVRENNLNVYALNTPRSAARAVASDKSIPASEIKWLPKRLVKGGKFDKTDLDKYRGASNLSMTTSDYAKQTLTEYARLRVLYESTIADKAIDIREQKGGPVVILVGIESLRNGNFGLVNRLREFDPSGKALVVLPTMAQNQPRFSAIEQSSTQAQDALRSGAKLYYYTSLPGRVVNK